MVESHTAYSISEAAVGGVSPILETTLVGVGTIFEAVVGGVRIIFWSFHTFYVIDCGRG